MIKFLSTWLLTVVPLGLMNPLEPKTKHSCLKNIRLDRNCGFYLTVSLFSTQSLLTYVVFVNHANHMPQLVI